MKFIETYLNELLTTALTMMIGFYLGMGWYVVLLAFLATAFCFFRYQKEKKCRQAYRREVMRGYGWHEHREREAIR